MTDQPINEEWLRREIERVWGAAGAHADIYGEVVRLAKLTGDLAGALEQATAWDEGKRTPIDKLARASELIAQAKPWAAGRVPV